MINWTGPYGASQQSTQRFGSLPTLRDAKMCIFEMKLLDNFLMPRIHNYYFFSLQHEIKSVRNSKSWYKHPIFKYIHFFQSAYAAKRRIDSDCDVSVHDRCRCLRLLRNEGLWPTDKWRYTELKSSEKALFFSQKQPFSDYQTSTCTCI